MGWIGDFLTGLLLIPAIILCGIAAIILINLGPVGIITGIVAVLVVLAATN